MTKKAEKTAIEKREERAIIATRKEAAEVMQSEAIADNDLKQKRKVVKAHVENILGFCNDFAKVQLNSWPELILDTILRIDTKKDMIATFGQEVINNTFCVTRFAADKKTRKQARDNDTEAKKDAQQFLNKAKLTLIDSIIDDNPNFKQLAKMVLSAMASYMIKYPGELDSKSFTFGKDAFNQDGLVLDLSARVRTEK